jgi:uncharacterized repeat protein (TIGR03803 family)
LSTSTVSYNGSTRTPTFVSSTQLTLALASTDVATGGAFPVTVTNPAPGGGTSNAVNFTVGNLIPVITSLSPSSVYVGSGAQTLTINGTGFLSTSTVSYNGSTRTPTFVSSTQLTVSLTSTDVATGGTFPVTVTNPAPGGTSNAVNFTVVNYVPAITFLSPSSVAAGSGAQTLTINGTNFLSTSTVSYNGSTRTPTFVSSTQLTVSLTSTDVATAGTFPVTVTNPAPGGTSSAVNFTVNNLAPTLTSLSPASAVVGTVSLTLTLTGTNFLASSTVTYNGVGHTATFLSSTQLTILLSTTDLATAGSYPVMVTNPTPGGGNSTVADFAVNNLAPTLISLSPTSAVVGSAAQTLTLTGTNFLATSTVTYNGVGHTVTFLTSTELTISLSTTDLATAGSYPVVVTNPFGGGSSTPLNFAVNNLAPTLTALTPPELPVNTAGPQTLTLTGTNFLSTSTVTYNGVGHTATFGSSTQLTISLSTTDLATAGSYPVVVTNPFGGGSSTPLNFAVNNLAPTLTALTPPELLVGTLGPQTLTLTGTNFLSTSTVTYNGVGHTATFGSSTQLTISLSTTDLATAGSYPVVVTNPLGGGSSTPLNFAVNNLTPTLTVLTPAELPVSTAGPQTLTLTGTNFLSTSTVTYNGVDHTATLTFVSPTQLTISLSTTDLATAGSYAVVVTNPLGGGPSSGVNFAVNNPAITSLSPCSVAPGSPAGQILTITGTDFLSTSKVNYTGFSDYTVTYVSSTELTVTLTAADVLTANPINVSVTNPPLISPLGTSNVEVFTVGSACASFTVDPSTAQLPLNGQQQFTAKVTGTSKTAVNWSVNGVAGGNATVGTISAAGLYTAPATVPATVPASATVTATSQASPKVNSSASVKIGAFNEKPLYSFTGLTDGAAPSAALIQGSDGYYYGTAQLGGTHGDGTVFKVDSSGNVTPLHEFSGKDGANPLGALIQASDGYFYGTTNLGGPKSEGMIFKMDSSGNLTNLHSFTGGADGAQPSGSLIQASDGYLYGATLVGGASSAGVVFRTDTSGNITTLFSFSGGTDGYGPEGSLIQATDGYFYGVTRNGGDLTCEILPTSGCGTIFRIDSAGNLTTLYSFTGGADGANPSEALLQGRDGSFYGTTLYGGNSSCSVSAYTGCGTIFKIDSKGNFTTMHEFSGGSDGGVPYSALIQASDGAFYGTATAGGNLSCSVTVSGEAYPTYTGCGTVFKMDSAGNVNGLYSFTGAPDDGANPSSSLLQGSDGYFYGTTKWGGGDSSCSYTTNGGCGTVFQVSGPGGP